MSASHADDWGSNPHISIPFLYHLRQTIFLVIIPRYDVIIAGAGPTGSTAARLCAEAGLSTLVIEEHATIGYPVQCAGLLSNSAFAECEVSGASVYHTVRGARICGSPGHEFSFDAGVAKAFVVDRGRLDPEMAERAACCGAEYSLKTCITQINPQKKTLFLTGVRGRTELSYNILIAADGPRSVIARGLAIAPPRYVYAGIQAEVSWDGCQDLVELHPNASPDFFAWMIPLSSTRARIGLCSMHHAPEHFAAFAEQFGPSRVHEMTGTIPLGVRNRTYGSGCLIAGDAAGFPKPISGGGVYTGIRSARHAAVTAIAAAECGDVSDASLATYERLWRADFGQELDLGLKALSLRRSLNQSEIDATIDALNHPDILELIIRTGDMDHPSVLLRKLLTKPKLISSFGLLGIKSMMRRICLCCRS